MAATICIVNGLYPATRRPGQPARAWPGAELTVVEDAGHLGNEAEVNHVMDALNRFAEHPLPNQGD